MKETADDYPVYHRHRFNLAIHRVGVPLFVIGAVGAVQTAINGNWLALPAALLLAAAGIGIPGIGCKREPTPPKPFAGPGDAVARIFSE